MKISICIPQYNRAPILMRNLEMISHQTYRDIEVVISDDQSTDDTAMQLSRIISTYPFTIVYHVSAQNEGYDRNYRKSIELANGDYAIVLGNDDTLYANDAIQKLVDFLVQQGLPDIGYCNYVEEAVPDVIIQRAVESKAYGAGLEIALRYYNGFSFVAGIIYKKESFEKYNTAKQDGSIYAQMYLGLLMIASGCTFFTMAETLVIKDISAADGIGAHETYKNKLAKSWKEYHVGDGGLPSVCYVLIEALQDALHREDKSLGYKIIRRMYRVTFPYWIMQYKKYGSMAAAIGLIQGLFPPATKIWNKMNSWGKIRIMITYVMTSIAGLLVPFALFHFVENKLRVLARD
jgi:glycosyltransferase involved in cell wall biosynthesis